jgi:galactokinase
MVEARELREKFRSLYGEGGAKVYRAPGRVNLIGEHTDYNLGFVMPAAIDFYTWVVAAPRDDRRLAIHSENFAETVEFDLDESQPGARGHWSDYPRGVGVVLRQAGYSLRGANLLVRGEVPIGSGLSSSAAIEVATGYALLDGSGISIDRMELAKLCQRAENEFVRMRCGLMDQFISCFGERGQALLLDCRSLEYSRLPLPSDIRLVIANTMVKHELASSEYNARRAECEEGVRLLAQSFSHVKSLRDATLDELEQKRGDLPPVIYKRCHHVISENERVVEAKGVLERGDLAAFGRLMAGSHKSLRDDYEVSCAELDIMVELANAIEGVYGARMTGGGFGGCTINLVRADAVASFQERVAAGYQQSTGIRPEIYICSAAQGAEQVIEG